MNTTKLSTIKFIKRGKNKGKILLNQVLYTGFTIGKIPNKFGFIYDEDEDREGYTKWFNRGGLTYIPVD
jgi:hypothetical protein